VAGAGAAISVAAILIPFVPATVWTMTYGQSALPWIIAGLLAFSAVLWMGGWVQAALIEMALAEPGTLSVSASYRRTWSKVVPLSWASLLFACVVLGGSFWLVLPGIWIGAALALAPIVCVSESASGWRSLTASYDLVSGRWFPVFLRLVLIGLATFLPSYIPWIGPIMSAFTAPFALVASCVLYGQLKAAAAPPTSRSRWAISLCLAGLIVPVFLGLRAAGTLGSSWPALKEDFASLVSRPPDPETAQKLSNILSRGLSRETITEAAQILEQARSGQGRQALSAVATSSASVLPAALPPESVPSAGAR
jgi:hypothetical protein